jgi:hypothetical protein
LPEVVTGTTSIATSRNSPDITAIFFIDDPPAGHHEGKQRKSDYWLQKVLFSEQESGSKWIP